MIGTGTIINTISVLAGGALGTLIGAHLPERVRETVMNGLGLVVLVIGALLALQTAEVLIILGSVLLGGIAGELLHVERRIDNLGRWIEQKITKQPPSSQPGDAPLPTTTRFSRAFMRASLVFCIGPMAIVGSFRDGLGGDYEILAVKSALDFFAAIAFASTMGPGVIFAAFTVLAYQGALTLGAGWASVVLTDAMVNEMTATGGVLMLAIGLGLLEIKQIRTGNLLPSLLAAPLIVAAVDRITAMRL